jgi:hypothetical protein
VLFFTEDEVSSPHETTDKIVPICINYSFVETHSFYIHYFKVFTYSLTHKLWKLVCEQGEVHTTSTCEGVPRTKATASETSLGSKQVTVLYISGPQVLVIPALSISVLTIPGLVLCEFQCKIIQVGKA